MKILRLTGSSPRPWGVDLHPRMTIVHGLPPDVAGPVRAAIDALVRARLTAPELTASGLGGTVLVDDREVAVADLASLTPGLVPAVPLRGAELVDGVRALTTGRARALDAEVAAVAGELSRAQAELAHLQQVVTSGPDTADRWRARDEAAAALRAARRRVADAVAATAAAEADRQAAALAPEPSAELERLAAERVRSARSAHDAAVAAQAQAEAEVERLAHAATAGLDALRAELAELDDRCVRTAPTSVPSESDRRALADRRAFLQAELDALASAQSTEHVATALAAAEAHQGIAVVEAARVAVEWERVKELVDEAEAAPPPPAPVAAPVEMSPAAAEQLARAHDDVTTARRAVAEASGASPLDPNDVEALEAAHAEVLSAWEGSERRIGVGKARRRLEEAQLAEREILARMGFASYTEFMVSGRASGSPSQLNAEDARRALRDAEARLASIEAAVEAELNEARAAARPAAEWDADAAQGRLSATLAALRARAVDLLGEDPGDDVAGALRDRISTDPLPDLRLALDEVGVPLGEVLSREAVLARAREWVTRSQADGVRGDDLRTALTEVEAQMSTLDAAEGARQEWEALVARRDALRAEVDSAVVASAEVRDAEERVVRDRADVARAVQAVVEAEADAARVGGAPVAPATASPSSPVTVDVAALEGAARDAQTALDVAVAHLLPRVADAQRDQVDADLGRAEAKVAMAQLELDALLSIRDARAEADGAPAVDADALGWRVLSVLASHRATAAEGGPGPSPLVLDEPFGDLDTAGAAQVCDALVGPSLAVQVIVVTDRDDVVAWARRADPDAVGTAIDVEPILGAGPR